MRQLRYFLSCAALLIGPAALTWTGAAADEPTREACSSAVEQVQSLAAALPAEDVSRYFAERDLHQALVEAGNGEFDDCLAAAARARDELRERRHQLNPGERLNVLRPDEMPPR